MRKFIYVLIVACGVIACDANKGYTVTGTVEGGTDGDTVYLMKRSERQFVRQDSAVIAKGKFTFTGVQDSAVNRYITYKGGDLELYMDFFLENGHIDVKVSKSEGADKATGTPMNDAYQAFKDKFFNVLNKKDYSEAEIAPIIEAGIRENSTSSLGIFILNSYNYFLGYDELEKVLPMIAEKYQNDEGVVRLKKQVEMAKNTAVGKKFVDLEMLTPEGKPVKLSDYAGKGKLVLVDFWASWCGPCRREMPKLVEAYAKYKNKGFEIVGVSFDKSNEAWVSSIKQLGITWPQMSDLKFWDSEGARLYAVRSIPYVALIDGEGTIIARGLHGDDLQKKLEELMK